MFLSSCFVKKKKRLEERLDINGATTSKNNPET